MVDNQVLYVVRPGLIQMKTNIITYNFILISIDWSASYLIKVSNIPNKISTQFREKKIKLPYIMIIFPRSFLIKMYNAAYYNNTKWIGKIINTNKAEQSRTKRTNHYNVEPLRSASRFTLRHKYIFLHQMKHNSKTKL